MSEKSPVALMDGPDKGAQKSTIDEAAFASEFSDGDVNTSQIINEENRKKAEAQQLAKLGELNKHLTDSDDRRRGLKAIYKSDLIDTMTDADIESFISDKLTVPTTETIAQATPEAKEQLAAQPRVPDVKTIAEREAIIAANDEVEADIANSDEPVRRGLKYRVSKLAGLPGRMVLKGYMKMFDRSDKLRAKYEAMTKVEQEKYNRKVSLGSSLGAAAIGAALYAARIDHAIVGFFGGGGGGNNTIDGNHINLASNRTEIDGIGDGTSGSQPVDSAKELHAGLTFSNHIDPFFQEGKAPHDFGKALGPTQFDKPGQPMGFGDLTQYRWRSSAEQMASIATGMGLDDKYPDNDFGMESLAENMKHDSALADSTYAKIMDVINNPNTKVTEIHKDTPYGSLYEVNNHGDGVIARDDYVDHGMQRVIVIEYTDKNGNPQRMELNTECGGQRRWDIPQPTSEVSYAQEAPQGNGYYETQTGYAPQGGGGNTSHGGGGNGGGHGGGHGGETPGSDAKQWDRQINTGMTPAGIGEATGDPAIVGNGSGSPDLTGGEASGSSTPAGVRAPEATVGTGQGRTEQTGNNGSDAGAADLNQNHENATGQATAGAAGSTGSSSAPATGRVE